MLEVLHGTINDSKAALFLRACERRSSVLHRAVWAEYEHKQASTRRCIKRIHIPWQRASSSSEGCWDTVLHLITWASSTSIWARSLWPFITPNCSHRQPLCCNNPPMLGLSYSSLPQLNAALVIWALGEISRIVLQRASRLKSLGLFYIKPGSVRTQQGRALAAAINHRRGAFSGIVGSAGLLLTAHFQL